MQGKSADTQNPSLSSKYNQNVVQYILNPFSYCERMSVVSTEYAGERITNLKFLKAPILFSKHTDIHLWPS